MPVRRVIGLAAYAAMIVIGSFAAWRLAPDVDGTLFPVLTDVYLVPYDPTGPQPQALFSKQLDRVCWRQHRRKTRNALAYRWLITIIGNDGARYFSEPVDSRTGDSFSNRNSYPAGADGTVGYCAVLPDGFDTTEGYRIESYIQYLPSHGLWTIEQVFLAFDVPGIGRER